MSNTWSDNQPKTAEWLLRGSKSHSEGQIRGRIQSLLESLEVECEVDYRTPGASGSCDMYLPRRRTIIETKRVGLADKPEERQNREQNPESPKQQLERYLRDEIHEAFVKRSDIALWSGGNQAPHVHIASLFANRGRSCYLRTGSRWPALRKLGIWWLS